MDRPTCIGCGTHAPNTDTNYTLISATFGWRLTRRVLPDGTRAVEWRCPSCWNTHKNVRATVTPLAPLGASRRPLGRAVGESATLRDTGGGSTERASGPPPPLRDK
jgi:hypothetical protein